ncbi:MAG: hypothetical protein H5U36_05935 [Candidatus Caldatribacterium sp.]|nr:hypothetical protein [Candidatus Caldatribacterium sp.]
MAFYVHILWHMHQPWYWDAEKREFVLPWVRTHATKDYLFMGKLLERFPSVRVTFNFVPSLLRQIELYLEGGKDRVMQLAEKEAEALTEGEKKEIVELFFLVASPRTFESWPRYQELWERRSEALSSLNSQDFLDLQILYQLIWFDPLLLQTDEEVKYLHEKGRSYTEEDKKVVFNATMRVLRSIIPQYRKLLENGQIEITFSPLYHPILPLLGDAQAARDLSPSWFPFPQDALVQIRRGKEYAERVWGREVQGMWPSEGSVSEEVLLGAAREGVRWVATGEEVLFHSLGRGREGGGKAPEELYLPHKMKRNGREIVIFFRDRVLSDAIGFEYHAMPPSQAVEDFMRKVGDIRRALPEGKDYIVNVILDGENAWEYYKDNGLPFLSGLYEALSECKEVATVTPSEYLRSIQDVPRLERLVPGSWIFGNFACWMGHPEKNWAWERLFEVRKEFEEKRERLSPEVRERVYELLLAAEGSDWFWWLGDDHPSPQKGIFVNHFLNLLEQAKHLMG